MVIVCGVALEPRFAELKLVSLGLKVMAEPKGRPLPKSWTDTGLSEALLAYCSVAVRNPVAVGLNVITTSHPLPEPIVDGQLLLVMAKSPALAPERVMSEKVIGASPTFVTCDPIPAEVVPTVSEVNTSDCTLRDMVWTTVSPTPVKVMLCGLPLTESVNCSVAVRTPVAEGVKLTPTEQVPPAARDPVQVFEVMEKSAALVPVMATEVKLKELSPVL